MTTEIKYHTKKAAISAVTENGRNLSDCTPEIRANEEVVMTALKENSWAIEYASDELKSNKIFIMKAIHEGAHPCGLVDLANIKIQTDIEVITLAVEESDDGWPFVHAQGVVVFNKELAAKALVKWGNIYGSKNNLLWYNFHPTMKEFFPEDSFYKKAQAYLNRLEQEKQADLVSGGSTEEDLVVW